MSHYQHLTIKERESILFMRGEGKGIRVVAKALGHAASTISREISRNKHRDVYSPFGAEKAYRNRRTRCCRKNRFFLYDYTKRYYNSTSGWTDDNADAFRHAVWMMLSAHYAGASYAREFGIAHEDDYRDPGPYADLARKMDLSNNDVGIEMAKTLPSNTPEEDVDFIVLMLVNDAVKNGELKRFKGSDIGVKSYLVPTNSVGSRKR